MDAFIRIPLKDVYAIQSDGDRGINVILNAPLAIQQGVGRILVHPGQYIEVADCEVRIY
jgi:hypothetical protein